MTVARQNFTDREVAAMMSMMSPPTIHKDRALLCVNCEVIFTMQGAQLCPRCGSESGIPIAKILDRKG